ncbi:MAG: YhgE/Pip domain-containing protein [Ligilactobacillus sp.]|nr:YhgE/Pip domain-containing protein [Ligilactobacillus sp.]
MKTIKAEFKHIKSQKMLLAAILAIMFIPFLYSVFFLKSVWNPYGDAKYLPVAVVNEDRAVNFRGKKLDVGDQLVKNLKKNDGLDWHFVSKKDAEYGLSHKEYYMVITIPKDFSKNATTVLDKDPKKMELQYTTNDSLNYIGKVISEEGAKQVNAQVKETVSTSYADTVFGLIKQVGKGFDTAAKGSKQLSDGSKTLSNGINTYTAGVSQVNDGVIKLQTGVVPLGQGVLKLADGSNTLANGINTYTAGVDQVNTGVSQLQNGTGALASGVGQLATGSNTLANGLGTYTNGVGQVNNGVLQLQNGTGALANGVGQLATGSNTLNSGLNTYTAGVAQLDGGLAKLHANSDNLRKGASDLAAGNQVLANTINAKADTIIDQLNSNDTKQALAGLKQLKQNAPAIQKQLQELQNTMNGLPTLLGGINSSANEFSKELTTNLGSAGDNISGSAKEVGEVLAANKDKLSTEDQQKLADAIAKNQAAGQNIQAARAAAQTFKDQLTQAQNSLAPILQNAQQMQGYVTQVNALLDKLNTVDASKLDELQGLTSQLEDLKVGAAKLATGSATLKSGVNEYTLGVDQAYAGASKFVANSPALTSGATQLAGGLGQLNAQVPTLTGGIDQLASGTSQLAANSAALRSGANQLAGGLGQMNAQVPTLTSGVNQLANGTQQLNANSPKLADGATQLEQGNSKLAKALAQGSEQVNDNTKNLSSKTSNMFASPTELKHKSYSYVPNYGYALAPYMLSVALYVGALVFNLVYPVRRLSDPDASATEWWLSKLSVGALVATGTSVVEVLLMMVAGLHPDHLGATLLNAWFFALASTFIVMFLAVAFGNIGRFLGIIFLVIQLGSCGGSFPIQVTRAMGGFFQMVNPFLPMTYSVYGFRESLTSGLGANQVWISVGVQLIYIIASIALLWVAMNAERSKVTYVDVEDQNLND